MIQAHVERLALRETEVHQLQEELNLKNNLLKRAQIREQDTKQAHEDCIDLLPQKESRLSRIKEELRLKDELVQKAAEKEQETNKAFEDQLAHKNSEVCRLKDELKAMGEVQDRAVKKRQERTRAHIATLDLLTKKDLELQRNEENWRRKYDELQKCLQDQTDNLQLLQKSAQEE
ncbi:Hypothetical predicted protein [Xyrichtys novacula]|uniref:Uncharacterized protein n=1 Tax=Xyrichtys novacula TaxID=13765 RepID=A0AAV1FFT7_XYRNO|nr:Hypothetical predicted protein [Xyrichtys novacula]